MRFRAMFLLVAALSAVSLLPFAHARPQADSVVLFIGDGMGPGQIEMTAGAVGHPLAMQKMPYSGTVTTLSIGGRVTDSAAASTALATGHKAENGVISVSPDGKPYQTILERCLRSHKTAGVITTDALWGATPAGFATHAQSRGEKSSIALQMAQSRAQVMLGYWKDELLTQKTIIGGWLHTGDIVKKDEEGYYYHLGRKDSVFKSGGEKIIPEAIEKVLREVEGVRDAAVIGKGDLYRGNTICAVVVKEKGSNLSPGKVISICQAKLDRVWTPHEVVLTQEIPRSSNGKIRYDVLREKFCA